MAKQASLATQLPFIMRIFRVHKTKALNYVALSDTKKATCILIAKAKNLLTEDESNQLLEKFSNRILSVALKQLDIYLK